ncbi:MAG: Sensory box histidine kinase/response regulator [Polyangiaceae bacterium]|jgi:CheY-like chemotaxis protein|nr:Sensory box histidine kinase/response regulator [Polyangiaceae bacterium]
MSSSFVVCKDCGDSSAAVEWGFVLLARHGWTAQLGDAGGEPEWRCPACNERHAASGVWDLASDSDPPRRRLRVLLVDDQVLVLRATAGMLRELDVVTAGSAAEALAKLADGSHFDVIVSDVSMPQMSGPELYVRIRERHSHLAERFLLLSGDSYGASLLCSAIARRENLPSMPKILDKPVPRDVLLREVDSVGHRRLPRSGTFAVGDLEPSPQRAKTK